MPESKVPWFVMTLMITRLKTQDAIVVANEGILGWDFYCIFFGFIILAGWLLFSRGWQVNPPQITTILINDSRRVWARLLLQSFLLQELVRSFFSECCPECRKQKEFFPLCLFKVFLGVFYHAKSPLNNHLGEYFQFFPTTLSKSKCGKNSFSFWVRKLWDGLPIPGWHFFRGSFRNNLWTSLQL